MTRYCVNLVGGGIGFKVNVADETGGLRVVGVFPTAEDASAWIASDRGAEVAGLTPGTDEPQPRQR